MSVKEIPKKFVYTCDSCGAGQETAVSTQHPRHWGLLKLHQDAYDFQDNAVADGSITRLLCPTCLDGVTKKINEWKPK